MKVAVVGTGRWGLQHARVFASHPRARLCAIVGRTPDKTTARAAQFGTRAYLDLEQMLQHERPDLVSVCLPNQEHFETTRAVIDAGYPLLVEKPLVFDLAEADTLLERAAARDLEFFAINFNHRFARPVEMARLAIERGDLGRLVYVTWQFGGEGGPSRHPYANLIETQCHGFDLLELACGPIASVMAEMTDVTDNGYSSLVLALRFASGAVGSLVGSYDASYAYPTAHRLEVNGTRGRVEVEGTVQRYCFQRRGEEVRQVWQPGYFNDRDRAFHRTFDRHVDALVEAFERGDPPPIHARAGRRALALAHAAVTSFQTGRRVDAD